MQPNAAAAAVVALLLLPSLHDLPIHIQHEIWFPSVEDPLDSLENIPVADLGITAGMEARCVNERHTDTWQQWQQQRLQWQ